MTCRRKRRPKLDKNVEIFLAAEKEHGLFDIPLGKEKLWSFLRLEVFRLIERQLLQSNLIPVPYRQVFLSDGRTYTEAEQAAYEEEAIQYRMGCDFLVVNNKHRFVNYHGTPLCPVTGILEQIDPHQYAYCTQVYSRGQYQLYDSDNDINYGKIRKRPCLQYEEDDLRSYVSSLHTLFSDVFHLELDERFIRDVTRQVVYVDNAFAYKSFYSRLLAGVRPGAVIVSSYYAIIDSVILTAAAEQGITTVEMQHGTIGNEHVAYNCLVSSPEVYGVPDYLAAYGPFDQLVPRNVVKKENVIPVGNLFLNRICREYRNRPSASNPVPTVLIVSFNMRNEELVAFALSLKRERPGWQIIYRFHPEENIEKSAETRMEQAGILCQKDFRVSIYDLVFQADYIVGTKSTVLYEALCFHKPTFVLLTEPDFEQWREAEKYMPHVTTSASFLQAVEKEQSRETIRRQTEFFYRQDGEETLLRLLRGIAEGR